MRCYFFGITCGDSIPGILEQRKTNGFEKAIEVFLCRFSPMGSPQVIPKRKHLIT
jgi:hypothetical protein